MGGPWNFGDNKNPPFFLQGLWGELWEKIWVENPHFPYGFLWPGWSGAQIPEIYWEDPRPDHPKFRDLALRNFQGFWGTKLPNPLGRGGHPSHPGQR